MLRQVALAAAPAARGYATALVKPKNVQLFGVDGRYAHALFSAASKKSVLPQVEKELSEVKKRAADDKAFANFLENPTLSRAQKSEAAQAMMKKKGYSEITVNFFGALAENNRLANTAGIIDGFETLMRAHRNEVTVKVVSASKLQAAHIKSLEAALKGFAKNGEKLNIDYAVDPAILGGLVVSIGDKHVDMSITNQINKVTKSLSQAL